MRVTLIETEGRGGVAAIEVEEHRLTVVDRLSAADRPAAPGPIDARLEVVVIPHLVVREPPGSPGPRGLVPDHGWRYRARGEIVSTRPLRADLGPLTLDLESGDPDAWEVGDRVLLAIDRIVLRPS